MEKEWIAVLGHKEVIGRPALYGTTKTFLDHLNLKSLDDLPALTQDMTAKIIAANQVDVELKNDSTNNGES